MNALQQGRFRDATGHFATGVCVITSFSENGPVGMTANSFSSLSLDPLLVVVCIDRGARTLAAVERTHRVGINILAADQSALAEVFASKAEDVAKFDGVGWSEQAGTPMLDGVVAWLGGSLRELHPGGDHLIGVVEIEDLKTPGGNPLLYYRGGYAGLAAADLSSN